MAIESVHKFHVLEDERKINTRKMEIELSLVELIWFACVFFTSQAMVSSTEPGE